MNKQLAFFLILAIILCAVTSCSRGIKVDTTRRSSDINTCEKVFGADLKTLKLENGILLQTGVLDTADGQKLMSIAIVTINKKEIILKQTNQIEAGNEMRQTYEGEGYKLYLNYKDATTEFGEKILKGVFTIENKDAKSEYDIVGSGCNL